MATPSSRGADFGPLDFLCLVTKKQSITGHVYVTYWIVFSETRKEKLVCVYVKMDEWLKPALNVLWFLNKL